MSIFIACWQCLIVFKIAVLIDSWATLIDPINMVDDAKIYHFGLFSIFLHLWKWKTKKGVEKITTEMDKLGIVFLRVVLWQNDYYYEKIEP